MEASAMRLFKACEWEGLAAKRLATLEIKK